MLIDHDFPGDIPALTARQIEVLDCLADHMTSKEIARSLGISPSMVDQHLRAISQKLGGIPRRELARLYAVRAVASRAAPIPVVAPPPPPPASDTMQSAVNGASFYRGFLTGFVIGALVVFATVLIVSMTAWLLD